MPYYSEPVNVGLDKVINCGDGYTIRLEWFKAYPDDATNEISYNIYYSTERKNIFNNGIRYVNYDGYLYTDIINLVPGTMYYFLIRPVEYDPDIYDYSTLPQVNNLAVLPSSILTQNITDTDLIIPLDDVSSFPTSGTILIGEEIILYDSVDLLNNNLELNDISGRGYLDTLISIHNTDGYDGYTYWQENVDFIVLEESSLYDRIYKAQCRFDFDHYAWTENDGYKQVTKDLLTTDLSGSDAANEDFPSYVYAGWHRTDPALLLNGTCVRSYLGGQLFCVDGYSGVGLQLRGLSVQDRNTQRQEQLLELTARPSVLLQRQWTGIKCACYTNNRESSLYRCPLCYGTGFVVGYNQYFNPRRADRRILIRFSPAADAVRTTEQGYESEFNTEGWTLTIPSIKNQDVIIRYDLNGNEEFRYEVIDVTRNDMLLGNNGGQKLKLQRIRKTDSEYKIRTFSDASTMPTVINTSIESVPGILLHSHTVVINENTLSLNDINQNTGINQGHNHPIINGIVMTVLGHSHIITL